MEAISAVDVAALAILALAVVRGLVIGLIRELFSLTALAAACVAVRYLGGKTRPIAGLRAGIYRWHVSIGEDRKTVLPRSPGIVRFGVCLGIGWVVSSRDIVPSPRSQGSRSGE